MAGSDEDEEGRGEGAGQVKRSTDAVQSKSGSQERGGAAEAGGPPGSSGSQPAWPLPGCYDFGKRCGQAGVLSFPVHTHSHACMHSLTHTYT